MCGGCIAGPAQNGRVVGEPAPDQDEVAEPGDGETFADLLRRKRLMNRRPTDNRAYEPAYYEHVANTISHAVGIGPSIYYTYLMIGASHRDLQLFVSCIYGFFTTVLFSTSTTYHFFELLIRPNMPVFRRCLHIVDRAAIYFFIAASYTPWLTLRHCGYLGVNLKWLIWVFACLGILYQYCFHEKYKTFETVLYVINAGGPAFAMFTMNDRSGLDMMVYGGLVYFVGVFFFKCDGRIPFAHAIWHLFVLVGAFLHMSTVYTHLLGPDRNNPVPVA
uniref:Monocyte to macrophage differentiation factor 2 n=1 Tax=Steinernema glaseri TaxID=37863 RepID=A0A1I7YGQ4_9BILA